jgi:DNA-binding IclR family transcriptional regulator
MTRGSASARCTLQQLGYIGKHPQTRRFQLLPRVIGGRL